MQAREHVNKVPVGLKACTSKCQNTGWVGERNSTKQMRVSEQERERALRGCKGRKRKLLYSHKNNINRDPTEQVTETVMSSDDARLHNC